MSSKVLALLLSALVLGTTGCALIGFDPIDESAGGAGSPSPSGGGGGGGSNAPGGSGGNSGGSGAGGSGVGGVSGAGIGGGDSDASIAPPQDSGMPEPDAGSPTACSGMPNGTPCEDGAYCTMNDRCLAGACVPGVTIQCGDECNDSACNELFDACFPIPVVDGTDCGVAMEGVCIDGRCDLTPPTCANGGECGPLCQSDQCLLDCETSSTCQPICRDGAECTTNCTTADTCDVECSNNSTCYFNCMNSGNCTGFCEGDSRCIMMCPDDSGCDDFVCLNGAECKLQCADAESCGFAECWDQPQECGNGVVICGSDCRDW